MRIWYVSFVFVALVMTFVLCSIFLWIILSYQVLGVERNASQREIQKAFHKYVLASIGSLVTKTLIDSVTLYSRCACWPCFLNVCMRSERLYLIDSLLCVCVCELSWFLEREYMPEYSCYGWQHTGLISETTSFRLAIAQPSSLVLDAQTWVCGAVFGL